MTDMSTRDLLMQLFQAAVRSADPEQCLPPALPDIPENGKLIILGAGKGSAAMVRAAEGHYRDKQVLDKVTGFAVTRSGFALPTEQIALLEAGHPVPDEMSVSAAQKALEIASGAQQDDVVLVLLSGGASALWTAPADGVSLSEKQELTRDLLASGAPIDEINCVRKHISTIKGGRLARAAAPARLITLAVSDVAGDEPSAIGSGPTVGDPTTLEDARTILRERGITPAPSIAAALDDPANETPDPGDAVFRNTHFRLVARPAGALAAAEELIRSRGYVPTMLGDALEGQAHTLGGAHGTIALECKSQGQRTALLSGGETTVLVRGDGRGGPNQEYALALALALDGAEGISALAADTDGVDGGDGAADDPAGAIIDETTLSRARATGLEPASFLENNDSTGFFSALDDLVITGPTHTNVNDFRVILIDP
ncbi:MAG: glycerate kinase [Hyphomicrobiales bacterium]|nr:glycerate kinase [Hyphomicrobiales bacterium]